MGGCKKRALSAATVPDLLPTLLGCSSGCCSQAAPWGDDRIHRLARRRRCQGCQSGTRTESAAWCRRSPPPPASRSTLFARHKRSHRKAPITTQTRQESGKEHPPGDERKEGGRVSECSRRWWDVKSQVFCCGVFGGARTVPPVVVYMASETARKSHSVTANGSSASGCAPGSGDGPLPSRCLLRSRAAALFAATRRLTVNTRRRSTVKALFRAARLVAKRRGYTQLAPN